MSEVTIDVAGRTYRLGCGEGEEEHLTGLGAMLDTDARGLLRQFGQMPEGRLLLMTALMIADRLAEAEDKVYQIEQRLILAQKGAANGGGQSELFTPEREQELTDRINELVARIETINGIESAPGR
jgi:cell division protein ZapA